MEMLGYDISGVHVLRLRGALEETEASFLLQQARSLLEQPCDVLINLEQVQDLSIYGIAALYDLVGRLGRSGARVGLVVPAPQAEDWETLMEERRVTLYPSELDGIQGMGRARGPRGRMVWNPDRLTEPEA